MITALVKTPAEIDQIEWLDAVDLFDYWKRWPPAHEALKRIGIGLGIEKKPSPDVETAAVDPHDPSGIGALIARFPDGFVKIGG